LTADLVEEDGEGVRATGLRWLADRVPPRPPYLLEGGLELGVLPDPVGFVDGPAVFGCCPVLEFRKGRAQCGE
jgi:hypothetical protein